MQDNLQEFPPDYFLIRISITYFPAKCHIGIQPADNLVKSPV